MGAIKFKFIQNCSLFNDYYYFSFIFHSAKQNQDPQENVAANGVLENEANERERSLPAVINYVEGDELRNVEEIPIEVEVHNYNEEVANKQASANIEDGASLGNGERIYEENVKLEKLDETGAFVIGDESHGDNDKKEEKPASLNPSLDINNAENAEECHCDDSTHEEDGRLALNLGHHFPLDSSKVSTAYKLRAKDQLEQGDGKRCKRIPVSSLDCLDRADGISPSTSNSRSRCLSLMPSIEEGIEEDRGNAYTPQSSASSSCSSLPSSPSLRSHHEPVPRVSSKPALTSISEELVYKTESMAHDHQAALLDLNNGVDGSLVVDIATADGDPSDKGQCKESEFSSECNGICDGVLEIMTNGLENYDADEIDTNDDHDDEEDGSILSENHQFHHATVHFEGEYLCVEDSDLPGWIIVKRSWAFPSPEPDEELVSNDGIDNLFGDDIIDEENDSQTEAGTEVCQDSLYIELLKHSNLETEQIPEHKSTEDEVSVLKKGGTLEDVNHTVCEADAYVPDEKRNARSKVNEQVGFYLHVVSCYCIV